MKIFQEEKSSWDSKVNFVDSNDVFVGYDTDQSCCEHAGWFIVDTIAPYNYDIDYDSKELPCVESYVFDRGFFQEIECEDLDGGGMIAFRLISKAKPDLYLHLFNCHNGYYGHGFEVKHGGEIVKSGCL